MPRTHMATHRRNDVRTTRAGLEPLENRVLFAAGDLDPTFSGDGIASFDYQAHDFPGGVAVQSDGKVVVVGTTDDINSINEDFVVARFNADGTPDATFGGGDGFVVTDFGRRDGAAAVEILSDGRILVAGGSEEHGTSEHRYALARYTSAGAIDTSFGGGDGMVESYMRGTARDMALQPDGKIVLSGDADYGFFGLARFNPNGTVDSTFGTAGKVTTAFNAGSTVANDVEIAPDGQIVAAGSFVRGDIVRRVVARYLPDGRIDTSFSGDGKFWVEDPDPIIGSMLVQGDGKIVVLESDFTLRRIRAGGGYDLTFGENGIARVPVENTVNEVASSGDLQRQADGKLLVTGTVRRQSAGSSESSSKLARLTPDGRRDTTFGDNGIVTVQAAGGGTVSPYAPIGGTAIAPDGKIVSTGLFIDPGAGSFDFLYDITVYRFQGDTTVPPPPTGDTWTLQAEDFERSTGTAVSRTHGGYTGAGYLDFVANDGASAEWIVSDTPGAGVYTIEFRYANGSASPRQLAFDASPAHPVTPISFAPTGSWSTWQTRRVKVTMLQGSPALPIFLGTTGENGPNIDRITVTYAPLPDNGLQLQAEQAALVGARAKSEQSGYQGTGYADYANAAGDSVEWAFDHAGGSRTLTFRYANGAASDRPLELRVNGAVINPRLSFTSTGSWSAWREVSVTVQLASGQNRVRLTSIGNNGPNIDVLRVS